jgi:methylated-DNA-[protein]-cysteine S-methyltransferase
VPQLSLQTPIGPLTVSEEDGRIVSLDWGWGRDQSETALLRRARDRLQDYFDGTAEGFDDLPLDPPGSLFQRRVWDTLRQIPWGATRTYADLARTVGSAPRAIGQAMARNPIPIIIPCHRVLATGGLGGYSGGEGLATKTWLLTLEGRALLV